MKLPPFQEFLLAGHDVIQPRREDKPAAMPEEVFLEQERDFIALVDAGLLVRNGDTFRPKGT